MSNHRGITITSTLRKTYKHLLKNTIGPLLQSALQFGFIEGFCPQMAVLCLTESISEAKANRSSLVMATLDSEKAFEVVSHPILFLDLFKKGIDPDIWLAGHVRSPQRNSMLEKYIQQKIHNRTGGDTRKDTVPTTVQGLRRQPPAKIRIIWTRHIYWHHICWISHMRRRRPTCVLQNPRYARHAQHQSVILWRLTVLYTPHKKRSLLPYRTRPKSDAQREQTTIHECRHPLGTHQKPQEWFPNSTDKNRLCKTLYLLTDPSGPTWRKRTPSDNL